MRPLDLISIATIRETVMAIDPDDDDLLLDMIEGSTDAGELLDALLERRATALALVVGINDRIDKLQERKARLIRQDEATKAGMFKLLEAAGLRKMERAEATVSIRAVPPKVLGGGLTDLPEHLVITAYSPDKKAIKAALLAGEQIEGWAMSNGGETISVRRA